MNPLSNRFIADGPERWSQSTALPKLPHTHILLDMHSTRTSDTALSGVVALVLWQSATEFMRSFPLMPQCVNSTLAHFESEGCNKSASLSEHDPVD